jgi:ubiquinone/menaquinone biosynthesis C-methylase UbiE
MTATLKDRVSEYWQVAPCGTSTVDAEPNTPEFFAGVEQRRYELEPFIPGFAEFGRWQGKKVLEVGVGLGTDFVQFARGGALLSGIDLTEASIDAVRRRLALEGLEAELRVADAEELPFRSGEFDLVYSWGVLHHTPATERALAEVRRVLRPGGEARIMLYSRRSWVALGVWLRYGLLRGAPQRSPTQLLAQWMESPGTKAYTQAELDVLFAGFSEVRYQRFLTPYDRRVGGPIAAKLPTRFGWFVGITAQP